MTSLHDAQARLLAFLDEHYHQTPHGGLFGKSPAEVWSTATTRPVDEPTLAAALTTHARRRVRKDGTLDVDGRTWQLDQSFLAGAVVTVAVDLTSTAAPVMAFTAESDFDVATRVSSTRSSPCRCGRKSGTRSERGY
jgi:hypothetical protein